MAFGEILKNARLQRGLTPSDVAESTHLLVQVVEDLEQEDFRRVAAPIYGRGFVKLYAEMLELDPEPLVRDFMDLYSGAQAPTIRTRVVEPPPGSASAPPAGSRSQPGSAVPNPEGAVPSAAAPSAPLASVPDVPPPQAAVAQASPVAVRPVPEPRPDPAAVRRDAPNRWVVEPEEDPDPRQEPDLFHPLPPKRVSAADEAEQETPAASPLKKRVERATMRVLPIFTIGGRKHHERYGPQVEDAEAHARRRARIQAFAQSFRQLREGVERNLPRTMPQKRLLLMVGAGVLTLVLLVTGIRTLFRLTGNPEVKPPTDLTERMAPPPDLYVD